MAMLSDSKTDMDEGFNTTFGFLARGTFSFREMSWILIKVFFGSSYLGFVRAIPLWRV